ncbi:MAG: hypothetical protein HOH19_09065 [Kordiimonadaceae bacterium]|jgi:hypothetical protein|nr:hypothetical protein [Kordiimonadaceae bacterium]MBT6032713.1 hypothetical protein [Kordiimonadaceae bacterium]
MNILKLVLLTIITIALSACGESSDKSTGSAAVKDAAANMEAATEEAKEEAEKRAQELEDLENQ